MKKPTLHAYRRCLQISVAIAFILIPWLNHLHISIIYGNFLSFHFAKFPLADPLAVLQVMVKNLYWSWDLFIGAGIALILASSLGTVFCSWVCPYGLMSEWTRGLSERLREKTNKKGRRKAASSPPSSTHRGFRVKIILFTLGLTGFFLFSTTPVLNQLSMPAWYSRIFQFWFEQGHISLAIVALAVILTAEGIAGRRLWCRYICPQSVLITLAKQFNPRRLQVRFDDNACVCRNDRKACRQACPLSLDPKALPLKFETECTNCGECVTACKKRGRALTFGFHRR